MGAGMAANLAKSGALKGTWNRTRARAEAAAREHSLPLLESPAEVARCCNLILISVSADEDVLEVTDALLPGLHPDSIVMDTSTTAATTARRMAAMVGEAGCYFLDAPVSGGAEGARRGSLAMMVGGEAAALRRAYPTLEAIAQRIVHMGPVGAGQAAKAANQIMVAGINQAVTEALAFATGEGLELEPLLKVLQAGVGANRLLERRGPAIVEGHFAPGFRVALHHKDLAICQSMAAHHGTRLSIIESTLADYQALMEQGHGDEDISALYRVKRALFRADE